MGSMLGNMKKLISFVLALLRLPPRQLLQWGAIRLRTALGLPARLDSPDRHVLEQQILPYYASRADLGRVLFVGCDWYSKHYGELFSTSQIFVTIDLDPKQAKYGAKRHLVASLESLADYVGPAELDLIVCNGVFGYGLDARTEVDLAMQACFSCLRPGGELMLGWNDVVAHAPFDPSLAVEAAGFERVLLPPLGRWRSVLDMPTRHTFEAYMRP